MANKSWHNNRSVFYWALAHLLANGMLHDVLLFGSFLAWAIADRISMKRRTQRPIATLPATKANDTIAVVGGLAAYVVMVLWVHQWAFGVAPV
ncbi:MAG: NnrU family protein [Marinobacter sp.]|uniref:NnrU family protein n=1 Tax=Marinobacter sp. TaxID=50741 RepID=UPI0029C4CD82|nr:NnrU family protein [Marinobacter sp.]MDX5336678.1 NnrU family protein [Marinobacter sp.]MDX5387829.1 NnrU family protein [Marinobacter sp.]MDX5440798.1 NnrU family protein [Alteromonadaceae bacterium]MDX5473130.1 NnrU family protein [Marinobacter sp.]